MQAPDPRIGWELWLPTGTAALLLGVSARTLKRYADRDEFRVEGRHWRRGPHPNSLREWDVQGCRTAITWRGRHGRGTA